MHVKSLSQALNVDLAQAGLEPEVNKVVIAVYTITSLPLEKGSAKL